MKKTATNIIFSIIWVVFLAMFLLMAYLSSQSTRTQLHRYLFVAPQGVIIGTREVNLFEEFQNLTLNHNKNVYELEKSIQREAATMTVLNGISAFLCLLGLLAQLELFEQIWSQQSKP